MNCSYNLIVGAIVASNMEYPLSMELQGNNSISLSESSPRTFQAQRNEIHALVEDVKKETGIFIMSTSYKGSCDHYRRVSIALRFCYSAGPFSSLAQAQAQAQAEAEAEAHLLTPSSLVTYSCKYSLVWKDHMR